jgi:hypothetical protein
MMNKAVQTLMLELDRVRVGRRQDDHASWPASVAVSLMCSKRSISLSVRRWRAAFDLAE